jgi:RNA 3'-terminal phosphate cyclase (ATP)
MGIAARPECDFVKLSPPFDYARDIWLPAFRDLGIHGTVALDTWGWFPVGKGMIRPEIGGAPPRVGGLASRDLLMLGSLSRVSGRAVAANLPADTARRVANCATALL